MTRQTLTWTALPNGRADDSRLKVSVFVSFRLETDEGLPRPALGQFPDLIFDAPGPPSTDRDWPERMTNAMFTVRFGPHDRTAELDPSRGVPNSGLWRALFNTSTFVRPYVFTDLTKSFVLSYPVMNVHDLLKGWYVELMKTASDRLPSPQNLVDIFGEQFGRRTSLTPLLGQLKKRYRRRRALPVFDTPDPQRDFDLLRLFYEPPAKTVEIPAPPKPDPLSATWTSHVRVPLPGADTLAKELDFHQRLAALNQYPLILRRLGVVVDLLVEDDVPPGSYPLTVAVDWEPLPAAETGVETNTVMPRTHVVLESSGDFRAERSPTAQELEQRMLDLSKPEFNLIQVDSDGLAIKVLNTMSNVFQQLGPTQNNPTEMGAPSPRTGGLAAVRTGKGLWLAGKIDAGKDLNGRLERTTPGGLDLYAEDLTRGYALDVHDKTADTWRSLCERQGTYSFVETGDSLTLQDEGFVQVGATQSADKKTNPSADQLYVHETLFTWKGWSLSVPRPGKVINPEDDPEPSSNTAPGDIGLEVGFTPVDLTLPRLRYGRTYRLRARAFDLAGNGYAPSTGELAGGAGVSAEATLRRFEPLPPPALALVEDGGALLEPREGESMDRVAIRSLNSTPAMDTEVTTARAHRYLLAPRISQAAAEAHGTFDLPTGKLDSGARSRIVTHDGSLAEATVGEARYAKGVVPLETPYLPDPLCKRLVVRMLDHDKEPIAAVSVEPIVFYGDEPWPAALPFRLLVVESGDPLSFDHDQRILTVGLPKGEVVYLRLSWALDAASLERMGLWAWRLEAGTPSTSERRRARSGGNWLLTPWRDVGLVHATQQPLVIPDLKNFNPYRMLDHTYVEPRYRTPLSRKTTSKVDLYADWTEPIDDPENDAGPDNLSRSDHAYELIIPLEEPYGEVNLLKTRDRPRHELGDTKYRRITYRLDATSRFREYLSASLTADDLKRSSPLETVFVPNAAQPDAPQVRYVIPTFGWEVETSRAGISRTRLGGSLRIYLERPWYSSGYGEMLAVVLPAAGAEPSTDLLPYLTRWGRDPIWLAAPVPGIAPTRGAFPRARAAPEVDLSELQPKVPSGEEIVSDLPFPVSSLPLTEVEGALVDIAPHDVGYDTERGLWYCDIEIETPLSYFPFIRLALARYHPRSVYMAHLSPVVLAEFAQLHPDRALSVTAVQGNPRARRLTLSGPVHSRSSVANEFEFAGILFGPPGSLGNVVEVTVDRRQAGVNTDLGWEPAPDVVTTEDVAPPLTDVLWAGVVELPQEASEEDQYRIVITEFEVFATEETDVGFARRAVYVDVVEL